MIKGLFASFLLLIIVSGCNDKEINEKATVFIKKTNLGYHLIRNDKPYVIKGVAGEGIYLEKLKNIGGNTLRLYDTTNLESILIDANKNNIAVIVDLPMVSVLDDPHFYNDSIKSNKQFKTFKNTVDKYKYNPALLMW